MASSPIISWQIDGEIMETVTDFIFLGSKIAADGDCSHEIKRRLLLGRKAMTNPHSVLKSRDITSPTIALPCFIVYSKAKLACYSGHLLTSYFCIPIPCDEKDIFWWGGGGRGGSISSRKCYRSS